MKVTLGALWLHFGVTLEPLWAYRRRMAGMMGVVASLMVSLSAPNGPINRKYTFFQRFFGFPRGHEYAGPSFRGSEPRWFEVILVAVWGQFGYLWVTLGHLMVTSQSLWSHLGYVKVVFKKE